MRLATVFTCLFLALLAPSAPAEDSGAARSFWRENRRLSAEVELAQKAKSYFVLDLAGRRVAVKARGMVLRELAVVQTGAWGRRIPIASTTLLGKDSLNRPARPQIRPGEEKAQESLDEQILEVKDMPADYHLTLEGKVDLEVVPAAGPGFWPQLRQRARLWRWRLLRPIQTLRDRRDRREGTAIYLVMKPEDARSLYWSFYEGIEGVIIPP